jgi:hypothetical protein
MVSRCRVASVGSASLTSGSPTETGCLGLALHCSFVGETFTTNAANSFKLGHTFTMSAVSEDRKTIYLARYLVADGGTTVENVIENFKVFFSMLRLAFDA